MDARPHDAPPPYSEVMMPKDAQPIFTTNVPSGPPLYTYPQQNATAPPIHGRPVYIPPTPVASIIGPTCCHACTAGHHGSCTRGSHPGLRVRRVIRPQVYDNASVPTCFKAVPFLIFLLFCGVIVAIFVINYKQMMKTHEEWNEWHI